MFRILIFITALALVGVGTQSRAHVPYLENSDFSKESPFEVDYSIEQSLAIYAWIDNTVPDSPDDIDVFVFRLDEPANVYIEILVPVCKGYENFLPWFAIAGPGLPVKKTTMPFDIPKGYGVEVVKNLATGEERETFYEFFGGKHYYKGTAYQKIINTPGTYYIYVWDPQQRSGDYVAVLGKKEIWRFRDIIKALRNTPLIRLDRELHIDCSEPQFERQTDGDH